MMHNGNNGNGNNGNISFARANRVEEIYDVILGAGCIIFSILALSNLLIMTINKYVDYYSRQVDRIVMDESDSENEYSDDDDDSSESEYSEYSENESSDDDDDNDDDDSDCHHHHHDDIELSPYIPPRRSERLAENRARCNSPLLVVRLKFE
jgi:hypothetical protein